MLRYVEVLREALRELLRQDPRVLLLGEDIRDPYGGAFKVTAGLSAEFPDRVINTPISEDALVGIATGFAIRGGRPILELMFGDFLALGADQIVNHLAKFRWMYNDQVTIPVVIRTPVGGRRGYGPTHSQSMERLLLAVPSLRIVSPSIVHNVGLSLKRAVADDNPVVFVEHKLLYPQLLRLPGHESWDGVAVFSDQDYYETVFIRTGSDPEVTIVTYGGMLPIVEEAARRLGHGGGIQVEIVVPSCIKPPPMDCILASVKKTGRVVIAEEGALGWGWGADVGAQLAEKGFFFLEAPIRRVGALDTPIPSARPLEDATLPSFQAVEEAVLGVLA